MAKCKPLLSPIQPAPPSARRPKHSQQPEADPREMDTEFWPLVVADQPVEDEACTKSIPAALTAR